MPHADPDVRGMFYGLSLRHTPAHLYRAIIEGICFGTEQVLDVFRQNGVGAEQIYITGSAAASRFWTQVHADVCDLPIRIPLVSEAPCLGSAVLGAVAAGAYPDIRTAAQSMVSAPETVEPDAEAHEAYMYYYGRYLEAYETMKDWMHSVTRHAQSG